jgi:hypothetical protein
VTITYFRSLYQAMLISDGNKEMCFAELLNNVNGHFCGVFISVFKTAKILFLITSTGCRVLDCSADMYKT